MFWSFSLQRLSSSKKRTPLFALNIFPGVNASMLRGPYLSALMGSMSPMRSSAVRSGLPWILMNLLRGLFFFVCVFLFVVQFGQMGLSGRQLYPQSLSSSVGSVFAMFFARVVFPIPGAPTRMMCLPALRALLTSSFMAFWPRMSLNSAFKKVFWSGFVVIS